MSDEDSPLGESPFLVNVENILSDFEGASQSYLFEEDVDSDLFTEIIPTSPLKMQVDIVRRPYGVELRIQTLETTVDIPGDGISSKCVYLGGLSREFHLQKKDDHPDDIGYIDRHHKTIDIAKAVEQEILISCLI